MDPVKGKQDQKAGRAIQGESSNPFGVAWHDVAGRSVSRKRSLVQENQCKEFARIIDNDTDFCFFTQASSLRLVRVQGPVHM